MKALVFDRFGGPEVLSYREIREPVLAEGEALVALEAIGLNFADVYRRRGHYHLAGEPPYLAGYEGAGVVVETRGDGPFRAGDRVGFADSPFANAERVAVPFEKLISLPDHVSAETAAALLLQGLTAQYLVRDSHTVRAGESALVHAAAGGVGQLLIQLARARGARVLGVVSTPEKAALALARGAESCALSSDDWVAAARDFSSCAGRPGIDVGVDVAFDSVGSTLLASLDAVRVGGHVVFYGMAGGDPPSIDPRLLMDTSKRITGGDLWNVLRTANDRRSRAAELFAAVGEGTLSVEIAARFALRDGAAAHTFLESRQSLGKILLLP